jgi:hypothetical protein
VEHILYIGGVGRPTPFTSTTESEEVAEEFASPVVWTTSVANAEQAGAKHIARTELLHNLTGFGKGRARWNSKWEVKQAAAYVMQTSEHLLNWEAVAVTAISDAIDKTFRKRGSK